jgi:hypothetical protein
MRAVVSFARSQAELVGKWIEARPGKSNPAQAWMRNTGVSIDQLFRELGREGWRADIVAAQHSLPLEAIEAAILYCANYVVHRTAGTATRESGMSLRDQGDTAQSQSSLELLVSAWV